MTSQTLTTKADLVGEFNRLASMAEFLMYSASDMMGGANLPNDSTLNGYDELTFLVVRRMRDAVEALTELPTKEASHA